MVQDLDFVLCVEIRLTNGLGVKSVNGAGHALHSSFFKSQNWLLFLCKLNVLDKLCIVEKIGRFGLQARSNGFDFVPQFGLHLFHKIIKFIFDEFHFGLDVLVLILTDLASFNIKSANFLIDYTFSD